MTSSGSCWIACARPSRWIIPFENFRSGSVSDPASPDARDGARRCAASARPPSRPVEPPVQVEELERGQVVVEVGVLGEEPQPPARRDVVWADARRGEPRPASGRKRASIILRVVVLPGSVGPEQTRRSPRAGRTRSSPSTATFRPIPRWPLKRLPKALKFDHRRHADRRSLFQDARRNLVLERRRAKMRRRRGSCRFRASFRQDLVVEVLQIAAPCAGCRTRLPA